MLDTIILFLADLSLTIAMFVLIFPATIASSIYIYDALHRDLEIRIDTSDHTQRIIQIASEGIRNDLKSATGRQFDAHYFDLRVVLSADKSRSFGGEESDAINSVVILTDRGQTEARQAYVSLLSSISENLKFTPLGRGGVLEIKRNAELYDFSGLIGIFYTAKNWVNIERENMLQMLAFLANDVNLGSIAFQTYDVSLQPGVMILSCTDGRFLDAQIEKIEKLPCDTNAVFPATTIAQQKDMLDVRGLIAAEFPITPFFLTSYSLVFVYYGMVFILAAGSIMLRLLQLVYSSGHLNVTTKPFTILSLLALPIIIGLKQVVHLFL